MFILEYQPSWQVILEEFLMKDVNLPAVEIIGFEGIWGVLMMVVLVYPALWFIPGPDHGHQEDLVDTLVMFYNSVYMAFSVVMETTSLGVVESSFFKLFQVDEKMSRCIGI